MKIIVGLGNPGEKYQKTRHNAGFLAVDFWTASHPGPGWSLKFKAEIYQAKLGGQKVMLAKPQTFMNNAGASVKAICGYYGLNLATDLLLVHDDVDLPLGAIRVSFDASSAGHKGVEDVIHKLGSQKFTRLRIGVNAAARKLSTEEFVLENFTPMELAILNDQVWPEVRQAINQFLTKK